MRMLFVYTKQALHRSGSKGFNAQGKKNNKNKNRGENKREQGRRLLTDAPLVPAEQRSARGALLARDAIL